LNNNKKYVKSCDQSQKQRKKKNCSVLRYANMCKIFVTHIWKNINVSLKPRYIELHTHKANITVKCKILGPS
jgi:hypothetical protein